MHIYILFIYLPFILYAFIQVGFVFCGFYFGFLFLFLLILLFKWGFLLLTSAVFSFCLWLLTHRVDFLGDYRKRGEREGARWPASRQSFLVSGFPSPLPRDRDLNPESYSKVSPLSEVLVPFHCLFQIGRAHV